MGKIFVLFLLIVTLIGAYAWLSGGAFARIQTQAERETNPVNQFFISQLGVPVAVSPEALAPATPRIGEYTGSDRGETPREIEEAKQFGDPSPLRGAVVFESVYTKPYTATDPDKEFVSIRAKTSNSDAVVLSGWSIQSAVSGARAYIGDGSRLFRLGEGVTLSPIALAPGAPAAIVSGRSPLGTSFRLNICSGYLEQFQDFSPSLSLSCPAPKEELPNTLENLQRYGASCVDFVKTLPTCTYHLQAFPEGLTQECRSFVTNGLSYNSCVARHEFDSNFSNGAWRIYLNSPHELWNNAHDVIRLLDDKGRTVDVLAY